MPLQLNSPKTALVLIDLEDGIVSMSVQPHPARAVVNASRSMADAFRQKGGSVIYVRVDLGNLLPLAVDVSRSDPKGEPIPASASDLVPGAGFQEGDLLITKRHWGALGQTELEGVLRKRGIETIVLAGLMTNFGIESTARQAASLGFHVVIAEDACSSIDATAHHFAMQTIFPLMARVRKSQEIIDAIA